MIKSKFFSRVELEEIVGDEELEKQEVGIVGQRGIENSHQLIEYNQNPSKISEIDGDSKISLLDENINHLEICNNNNNNNNNPELSYITDILKYFKSEREWSLNQYVERLESYNCSYLKKLYTLHTVNNILESLDDETIKNIDGRISFNFYEHFDLHKNITIGDKVEAIIPKKNTLNQEYLKYRTAKLGYNSIGFVSNTAVNGNEVCYSVSMPIKIEENEKPDKVNYPQLGYWKNNILIYPSYTSVVFQFDELSLLDSANNFKGFLTKECIRFDGIFRSVRNKINYRGLTKKK